MQSKYNKPILRKIWRFIYTNKGNCIVGITGRVRTGKSHFSVKIGSDFDSKFKIEESLVYTVEALIRRTLSFVKVKGRSLTLESIQKIPDVRKYLLDNVDSVRIKPGKVIIFDEAGNGAYVREFFSKDNKTISKIVQIWAFLRILVIVVVPEDLHLAESTLIKFMNVEVRMLRVDYSKNEATCIAWEHLGWNKRTREPVRRRLKGCRHGGIIRVKPLDPELAAKYENVAKVYKLEALIQMGRQYEVDKVGKIGSTKTIWDDIEYVKKNIEKFRNEKGKVTVNQIRTKLGVSLHKAAQIREQIVEFMANKQALAQKPRK